MKRLPFSNGTEYGVWTEVNCGYCSKGWREETHQGNDCRCDIEQALLFGYLGDGQVEAEIVERANLPPTRQNDGRCGEFEREEDQT